MVWGYYAPITYPPPVPPQCQENLCLRFSVIHLKIHKQILNKIVFSSTDWLKQHNSTISAKNFPFNEEIRKVIYTVILCPCAFLEDIGSQLTSKQLVPLARTLRYHLLIRALNKSQFSSTYKQESSTCFKCSIHAQMLIHPPYTECYQMCFCCLCSSYLKPVSKVYWNYWIKRRKRSFLRRGGNFLW